jgi:hypothetical protein
MRILHSSIGQIAECGVTEELVSFCKDRLKNRIASQMKSPLYWTSAIRMRYLNGKDFTTDYAAKIDSVTAEDVRKMLLTLVNSSKVEYIINK